MPQPIPAYLIAIAVGDLAFAPLGPRSGVYAEPSLLARAAHEFADTEKMMEAAENLYGPYRWERYDVLVLPPSFPFGGMENPRLTFATPTVLAGDRSLVSLIAHELAHSWSGNLVTNATWSDFWLNEGFTTYIERRIDEDVYGEDFAAMEAVLGRRASTRRWRSPEADEILMLILPVRPRRRRDAGSLREGRALSASSRGALRSRALRRIPAGYFDHFAFQSITTADFVAYLEKEPARSRTRNARRISRWRSGSTSPDLPHAAPNPQSDAS